MNRCQAVFALSVMSLAGLAVAQPVVFTQWNFNTPSGQVNNNPAPSTGRGTAVPLGMTNNYTFTGSPIRYGSTTVCDITGAGASGDTASSPNNCWRVRGSYDGTLTGAGIGWALAAPQYSQGAEFDVSTLNYGNIVFTFDWFTTNQGVNKMQVQYSINGGATWVNTGPLLTSATNGWINNNTVDLSSVAGISDNPNFRIRLVSAYSPGITVPATFTIGSTVYTAAQVGLVAGANTYGGASGGVYNNNSGNWRFDRVTFTGTPLRAIGPSFVNGSAVSNPPAVCSSGGQMTLTVAAQGGANPLSTNLTVTGNLSAIGLSANQAFRDDGQQGDALAGDGVFTYVATVPAGLSVGTKALGLTVADAQGRSDTGSLNVAVGDCSASNTARVVISQTFGGGGNLGVLPSQDAPFNADYVELYNRSNQAVSLDGWSVQYASPGSAAGFASSGDQVLLSGSIQPGQYVLVRMSDPIPGFNPLPTPDFAQLPSFGGMGNLGGRVALVRSTTLLGTDYSNANIEDFVGYGSAANYEGVAPTPAPSPSSNTALFRKSNGAQDTNQNFNDFVTGSPSPRNRASNGYLAGYASLSSNAACAGSRVTMQVAVSSGSSSGIVVNADVSGIVGSPATVQLFDDGSAGGHGDANAGDGIYTLAYTIPAGAAQGVRTIGFTVADSQGHSDTSTLPFSVGNCVDSSAPVVISKVYGGGGNDGSGFNGDFAELFNRSSSPVNLAGWSFQSCRITDAGFDSRIVMLTGVIMPGENRLIVTNQLSPTGAVLPTADFVPAAAFGMESSFGRVALVSTGNLIGSDFTRSDIVDLVGYGSASPTFEGVGPTGTLGDISVAVRKQNGCQDTNQNAVDFDVVLALTLPLNSAAPAHPCGSAPACGQADLGRQGGVPGSDGLLDNNDFIVFIDYFFNSSPLADVGRQGGVAPGDGQFDNNDFIVFIDRFFAGCN